MQSFTELDIKNSYESGEDDIVDDFYVPVLSSSVSYDRIAGFFSSSSLAVAARGIADFITHEGFMRLLCCPLLGRKDAEMLARSASGELSADLVDIRLDELQGEIEKDHVKALGWMLLNKRLEIRLAIVSGPDGKPMPEDDVLRYGLFHQKVGILYDRQGNGISFSGSINESGAAWTANDEEFKVFTTWRSGQEEFFNSDRERFKKLWNGEKQRIRVFRIPDAVRKKIIRYAEKFNNPEFSAKYSRTKREQKFDASFELYPYQHKALIKWRNNSFRLLFEMATGTGKTRTAIAAIEHFMRQHEKVVVVVASPQTRISNQWYKQFNDVVKDLSKNIIVKYIFADGANRGWREKLKKLLNDQRTNLVDKIIIFASHITAASDKFTGLIKEHKTRLANVQLLFAGDEAHHLGAPQMQKALLEEYETRIGLSATPERMYDDEGTQKLESYFGNGKFEFSMDEVYMEFNPDTHTHTLVPYEYHIHPAELTEDEMSEYGELTGRIARLGHISGEDRPIGKSCGKLLADRAEILKNAANKHGALRKILANLWENKKLENLIVFASPAQCEAVLGIMDEMGVSCHDITQRHGTKPSRKYGGISEREHIIKLFEKGEYKVLVAIKCLDEGIDIPCASRGILMASGANPREWVQRLGRIIRREKNKKIAELYDIAARPPAGAADALAWDIRKNENKRLKAIAKNAINRTDALIKIDEK